MMTRLQALLLVVVAVLLTSGLLLALGLYLYVTQMPRLAPWHTQTLSVEFSQQRHLKHFDDYLQLEQQLFNQLDDFSANFSQSVSQPQDYNRYYQGSFSDPKQWPQQWNQSYYWPVAEAEFGILLVHGMSDSPYALSNIANAFKGKASVLGLRLPGHGTLPSALVNTQADDLLAATTLAIHHLRQELKGKPIYFIGFSTGAAIGLNLELKQLQRGASPYFERMVFISPAIGLTPLSELAKWQTRIGQWFGIELLAWNSIKQEYDPYRYGSFAINAADTVLQLVNENRRLLAQLTTEQLAKLPAIQAFQSISDNTVSTQAIITDLFQRLGSQHQLVLFDINRVIEQFQLLKRDPRSALVYRPHQDSYQLTVIENVTKDSPKVQAYHRHGPHTAIEALDMTWPNNVYSLSHIALPFAATDPVYGNELVAGYEQIALGRFYAKGEAGVHTINATDMLRQKWNPFFDYMLRQTAEHVSGAPAP
ncbi:carboxylesterase [Shewanella sp. NIFS-20-20]|uniref:alpha/beta hydrolase n=1 Tax=Shewanella sp. NIFS-20-20 TaxID=2853806 RepID=UPI001C458071|nr:alpha/beta fold hydrolase [Shewanella sp. NIFS-20-20]MBV7317215.1 alpha/beta fold hydrolase [Shewanella sp. NIFS-20-20]